MSVRPIKIVRTFNQKVCCLNPHHSLVGLTSNKKNEGQLDQNFGQSNQNAVWLFQPSQKVKSAYKISVSACARVPHILPGD